MPTQKEAYFEGRMGPLIFYKRLGQNCIRSVPHEVRQNNATKSSAFVFGRASKMAKNFRKHLLPIIPFPGDIKMQNRLISTIYKWIHSDCNAQEDRIHTTDLFRNFLFTNEGNAFKKDVK
jgi:hypothetical protein